MEFVQSSMLEPEVFNLQVLTAVGDGGIAPAAKTSPYPGSDEFVEGKTQSATRLVSTVESRTSSRHLFASIRS